MTQFKESGANIPYALPPLVGQIAARTIALGSPLTGLYYKPMFFLVLKGFKYRLRPTRRQARILAEHLEERPASLLRKARVQQKGMGIVSTFTFSKEYLNDHFDSH